MSIGTDVALAPGQTVPNPQTFGAATTGKVGMWMAPGHPDNLLVRRQSAVDYWDGED